MKSGQLESVESQRVAELRVRSLSCCWRDESLNIRHSSGRHRERERNGERRSAAPLVEGLIDCFTAH
jgi:hypothetical protein